MILPVILPGPPLKKMPSYTDLKLGRIQQWCKEVTHPTIKVAVCMNHWNFNYILAFDADVTCVLTGRPIRISMGKPIEYAWTYNDFINRVRDGVHEIVTHEADEMLLIAGERVFNPHLKSGDTL